MSSQQSLAKKFSLGIKNSAGIEGIGSTSNSLSYSSYNIKKNSSEAYFAYAYKQAEKFKVELVNSEVKLTDEFIRAVEQMSSPNHANNFVKKWGTHYAKEVTYGGKYFGIKRFSQEEFMEAHGSSVGASHEANISIDGVSAGGGQSAGFSRGESYLNKFGSGSASIDYVGGNEVGEAWSVDNDNAEAIEITLDKLSNLLKLSHFQRKNSSLTAGEIAQRKQWLTKAIASYLTDKGVTSSNASASKNFKVIVDKFVMKEVKKEGDDDAEVSGWVRVSELYHSRSIPQDLTYDIVWRRTDKNVLKMINGQAEPINKMSDDEGYTLKRGKENKIAIYGGFTEHDTSNKDDYIGNATEVINLNQLNLDFGEYKLGSFTINDGGCIIQIFYTIYAL